MKLSHKIISLALLAIVGHTSSAEMEFEDVYHSNSEEFSESRFQLKLFPGIARASKKTPVMTLFATDTHKSSISNLNTNLTKHNKVEESKEYLEDIEVISNNILEIRF